jgi:small subunit ribosomal protein S19
MSRSKWKGPFFKVKLLKKVLEIKNKFKRFKVWSRNCTILREFVNHEFDIHNGNKFIGLRVTNDMIGHKFGEFASTRRYAIKKKKGKKGKKN